MKKAIILIPVGLLVGGLLYQIIQTHRVIYGLASRYPSFTIYGKIKRGRI